MAFTRWWISLQLDFLAKTCKLVVSFFDKFSVFINELWVAFLIFSLVTVKPNLCVTTDVFARLRHQRQKPFIAFDVNIPGAGNIFIDWNIKEKTPEAILTCLESYGLLSDILIHTIDVLYIHYYAYESRDSTPALASCWICSGCPEFKSSATLVSSQGCLLPVGFLILLCSVWITCFKLFECSPCKWWTKCTFHYKQTISTTWRIMSVTKISFFLRRAFFAVKILTFFHLVLLFFICE